MSRPTRTEVLLRQAEIVAARSTCSRAHVGVVIAHEGRVVSQGYNGAPAGMAHCRHTCTTPATCAQFPYLHTPDCDANEPCTIAVHAEANAIAFAARYGVATSGASLYTTLAPCRACAMLIINCGIRRVIYLEEFRDMSGIELLNRAEVPAYHLSDMVDE